MEKKKPIVDYPCRTCTHTLVCTYRSEIVLLADYLETLVKEYTSRDTFPNGIANAKVGCSFYNPSYISQTSCGSLWPNQTGCC